MWNECTQPYGLPSSLFGNLLVGNSLTQFIYTDEAGHEDTSPRTVVAGVLVHADTQLLLAEQAIEEALRSIPEHLQGIGPISVKALWGDERYRENWSFASRKRLILNLMSIPRKNGIPVAFSLVKRGWYPLPDQSRLSQAQFDHITALAQYAARVDKAIRDHRPRNEVGILIYEDMDYFREKLEFAVNLFRERRAHLPESHLRKTAEEEALGYFLQEGDLAVERIRRRVLFMKKGDDPLLILADAAAFAVRRYFGGEDFGDEFIEALLGEKPDKYNYEGGVSVSLRFFPQ